MADRGAWPHDLQKLMHHSSFTTTESNGFNTQIESIRDRVATQRYPGRSNKTYRLRLKVAGVETTYFLEHRRGTRTHTS